jgi:ABC-type nitrate/sulfonate/bicarbonate transport system ATPase subunit
VAIPGLVELRNVSQLYAASDGQPTWALREISLRVNEREFVCVIGPSGCGKTTLLHLIAGFIRPTDGEILFKGTPILNAGPSRGVVFQEYALFAWMTARQNVEFGLRMRGVSRLERRDRANRFLQKVGLVQMAERYPHELSGGMRQRVAVARALINEPEMLLMDEPFAAVDAMTRATLQEELLRIWQEFQLGVLFITHNIDEAIYLAQRVIVMSAHPGTIQEDIQIDLAYPRSRTSKEFGELYTKIGKELQR